MKRQRYLPGTEAGINEMLIAIDTNLPGTLATTYGVDAAQLRRLHQGRLVYGWFTEALEAARTWSQSLTAERDHMFTAPAGPDEALPGMPMLPAVPTLPNLTPPPATVAARLEPDFFDYLGRLVQQIKTSDAYDEADGVLLKIVGAEVPPPDPEIVPEVKSRLAPNGCPMTIVKKSPFQGYTVWVARGSGTSVEVGFSSSREFIIPLALPAAGVAEVWTIQVQYRYRNAPFGMKSLPLVLTVRG